MEDQLVGCKLDWHARIASFRNVMHFVRMIWDSSPPLLISTAFFRLSRAIFPLALLWVPKLILDTVVNLVWHRTGSVAAIWHLLLLEFALAIANDAFGRIGSLCESLLGDKFTHHVSVLLIRHASTLDLASFEDSVFHDKLERARSQTGKRLSLFAALLNLVQETGTLVTLSAGLLIFYPWLVAFLVSAVIPSFVCDAHFSTLAYSTFFRWTPERRRLDYLRLLGASAHTAKEIKLFGLGEHLAERYASVSKAIYQENGRLARRRVIAGYFANLVATGGYYGAYAVVLARTLANAISIGTFTFLVGSFSRSRWSIQIISDNLGDISEQGIFLSDLFDFFAMRAAIRSLPNARRIHRPIVRGFEFRNVSFAYAGSEHLVIRDVSFELRPGEKMALIGENGAGKTTIVKLMTRLYDPTDGQILLDGVDLRDLDLEDLHRQTSVIFQNFVRYDMLVHENIAIGDIESCPDRMRVKNAAQWSQAENFIRQLPHGYDQMIGRRFEGGVDLSGGEWQKLALARSYIRDAQVVILDEPTAHLDANAEYQVFRRFTHQMTNRMAVLISHRFSTARLANMILVLENGTIHERGTHDELLALNGRYAGLFELQAAGYR